MEQNNDVLKKLGINGENAQWMVATAPDFFKWIQDNISDENILSHSEVKEYEELEKAGKLLSKDDLEQKLEEIEKENPGLSTCSDTELQISSRKLKKLRDISENQKKMMDDLYLIEKSQETKLEKTKLRMGDLEKETKVLLENASHIAQDLQNVEQENRKLYQDLQNSVNTPKIFTHQMPFYEHFNFIEEFIKQLERYCEQNQILTAISVTEENYDMKLGELQVAKDGFVQAYYQEILLEMQIAAMEAVANEIKSGSIQLPTDMNQLMSMLSEFSSVNDQKESQVSNQKQRINERINEMVLSQIELLSTKNIKYKHNRATNRISNITQLKPFVTKAIQVSEILWFALNFDWERLNKDFSCDDFGSCHSTHMRLQIMKRLLNGNAIPRHLQTSQDQVVKTIAQVVGMNEKNDLKEIIQAYSHFERDLSEAVTSLGEGVASQNAKKYLKELEEMEKALNPFIYGGTTSKPQLGDPRFTKKILKISNKNKIFQEKYTEMKVEYKKIEDAFAQDKFYRYSHVLWIWFLTEPIKVLQAIKEVQKATEKLPAHLSGLRRQN